VSGIVRHLNFLEDDVQIFLGAAHYYLTVDHKQLDSALKGFELGTIKNHIVHSRHYLESEDPTPLDDLDVAILRGRW